MSLQEAFVDELKDAYDAEKQLLKALSKMAKAATSEELSSAFESHLEETRGHVDRLEQVFQSLDERVRGKRCDGIAGIIEEGKAVMEEDLDEQTLDACLIAAGQRAEHYEMAAYGTLVAWAKALGYDEAAKLLQTILDEEKAADEKLTTLAEEGINQQAADAGQEEEDDDDEEEENDDEEGVETTDQKASGGRRASADATGRQVMSATRKTSAR